MTHDQITGEVVITATEFKAKCLELLDRVKSGAVTKVHITKRGREVGLLTGPDNAAETPWDPQGMFGSMRGQFAAPEGIDIVAPIYAQIFPDVPDAEQGKWEPIP